MGSHALVNHRQAAMHYKLKNTFFFNCVDPVSECKNDEFRLADGAIEQEGRPEVCFNGAWGSICGCWWDRIDAYIFCKTLGYDGPSKNIIM